MGFKDLIENVIDGVFGDGESGMKSFLKDLTGCTGEQKIKIKDCD